MEVPTVSVKDMLPFQRPREKFLALGPSHMAMEELLAILLRTGVKGQSAISLASDIVQSFEMCIRDRLHLVHYWHLSVSPLLKVWALTLMQY